MEWYLQQGVVPIDGRRGEAQAHEMQIGIGGGGVGVGVVDGGSGLDVGDVGRRPGEGGEGGGGGGYSGVVAASRSVPPVSTARKLLRHGCTFQNQTQLAHFRDLNPPQIFKLLLL